MFNKWTTKKSCSCKYFSSQQERFLCCIPTFLATDDLPMSVYIVSFNYQNISSTDLHTTILLFCMFYLNVPYKFIMLSLFPLSCQFCFKFVIVFVMFSWHVHLLLTSHALINSDNLSVKLLYYALFDVGLKFNWL